MITLLDVNALVAIAWPEHVHHDTVVDWFDQRADAGWATCPTTEFGFVRISANPAVVRDAVRPGDAVDLLTRLRQVGAHHFWDDDVRVHDTSLVPLDRLVGHRQVADAHLLGVSRRHGGALATLDKGLVTLARGLAGASVELIGPVS